MKIKDFLKIIFSFFLFINFFFSVSLIKAQEGQAPNKKCLIQIRCIYQNENEAEQYIRDTYTYPDEPGRNINPNDLKNQTKNESLLCSTNLRGSHSVKLFTDPRPGAQFPANTKIYVAECLYGDKKSYGCTTMNSNLDEEIFGIDMFKKFQEDPELNYNKEELDKVGVYNEEGQRINSLFSSNASGKIPVLQWWSYTKTNLGRRYYGFFKVSPQQTNTGAEGGIQNAMPSWPPFQDKDCVSIAWDPEGRVFDAKSLEPIPQAKVTILNADGNFFLDPTVPNPVFTSTDGRYSFYVPNGSYKLKVEHPNYNVEDYPIDNISFIHPNYLKIYYDIYTKSKEIIVVENELEHRDIPLFPKRSYPEEVKNCNYETGCNYPIDEYFKINEVVGDKYKIEIKQSHPYATVTVKKKEICVKDEKETIFTTFYTDANGYLNKEIPLPEGLGCFSQVEISPTNLREIDLNRITFYKNNKENKNFLTTINKIIRNVLNHFLSNVIAENERTIRTPLEPIFRYLEGYAYDKSGNILPNTKVGIYVSYSSFPYYLTKTDDKGYFKISSNNLPNEPYKIRYLTNTGTLISEVGLTEFVSKNKNYLTQNKINLNQIVDEKGRVITPIKISPTKTKTETEKPDSFSSYPTSPQSSTSNTQTQSILSNNKNNLVLLTVLILIILIVTVGVLLYFYYQKNRSQSQI